MPHAPCAHPGVLSGRRREGVAGLPLDEAAPEAEQDSWPGGVVSAARKPSWPASLWHASHGPRPSEGARKSDVQGEMKPISQAIDMT